MNHLPNLSETQKTEIKWIAVNDNVNITINHGDLRFFRALETLILPLDDSCNQSFVHTEIISNHTKICTEPVGGCHGVTCPSNSHCAPDGPGLSMCLCNDGWHSYRCLKKDGFPAVQWIAGFSVTTILICVSLKVAQKKSIVNTNGT